MDYVKRGSTEMDISRLCLSCMTFGEPNAGDHPWTLGEAESRSIIGRAVELGIKFFDTINMAARGAARAKEL
ncbi:hypothetical protein ACMAUO_18915 [Gluconacetobacter sp. Hr-1-5]|uniref:hypothetical protein n=1 Tax=Gluconacetobacter sp. Hr-1-5 TaxID=3395370 RepID=UPI003B520875